MFDWHSQDANHNEVNKKDLSNNTYNFTGIKDRWGTVTVNGKLPTKFSNEIRVEITHKH